MRPNSCLTPKWITLWFDLTDVSALFPYIIPHVHGKWRLLASALGLKETDLQDIKEIPHEKKSKYAQNILELWTQKEKNKATKTKLLNALRDINSKRAIGEKMGTVS